MRASPKRILIYRIGSLGDTVVALPSLHLIARAFPNAERRLLTNFPIATKAPASAAILENTGLVHGYFRYSIGTRDPRELLALWWRIVRFRPDALIYLSAARGTAAARRDQTFFRACGIRNIIGVPLTDELQQNLPLADGRFEPEAGRLARTMRSLGDAALDTPASWSLNLTPDEHQRATQALEPLAGRPFFAISLGTKVQANEWGNDRWRDLLSRLSKTYPTYGLAIFGAKNDHEASEYVAAGWRTHSSNVVNLCGLLTPRQSAAALSHAAVFLGHDSGPMHLAAAVQTPCVAVFSARQRPGVWFPYGPRHRVIYHQVSCWNCNLDTCTIEQKRCIYSITVDKVLGHVHAILD